MENEDKYQMFTLLNNEVAVDVDLSSVECGINAALYFVAMEPDGGLARYPTNKAGAKYGTGYCDASCPRSNRFNGGKVSDVATSLILLLTTMAPGKLRRLDTF